MCIILFHICKIVFVGSSPLKYNSWVRGCAGSWQIIPCEGSFPTPAEQLPASFNSQLHPCAGFEGRSGVARPEGREEVYPGREGGHDRHLEEVLGHQLVTETSLQDKAAPSAQWPLPTCAEMGPRS